MTAPSNSGRRRRWRPDWWTSRSQPSPSDVVREDVQAGQTGPEASRLSADQPIGDATYDRLERLEFAHALAEDIRRAPRQAGFVIAVTGVWGEGKTSVINLVDAELRERRDAVVVHFNPFCTEQLVEHFFDELVGQLRETRSEHLTRVASALATYGKVATPLSVLPYIGEVLRSSGDIAKEVSGAMTGERGSARARAKQLRERLSELDKPIVVVVDDLDRLRSDEIVDVMRLVRLVGDFPNLMYLLAFDRPRVEEALGDDDPTRGRAYLEKIVQVTHALPPVREAALTTLLSEDLGELVGDLSAYQFDRDHFQNLFAGGFRQLFLTVRDVRRFTNVLPATLALLRDEVELGDTLALESLRVFVPQHLRCHRDAPTSVHDDVVAGSWSTGRRRAPRRNREARTRPGW